MPSPRLTLDLDAVAANLRRLAQVGGQALWPVVKADAYGLGAAPVARRLRREGAPALFVARLEEAARLREAGDGGALLVLDGVADAREARELSARGLTPVLNSPAQVADWSAEAARLGRALPAALHVDTGLNRLGLSAPEAAALADDGARLAPLQLELLLSHWACADDPAAPLNALQAQRFAEVRSLFPRVRASLAATAGLTLDPRWRHQVGRPGIGLYGGGAGDLPLQQAVRVTAPILMVRDVAAGEPVGYGAAFVAPAPLRVAVIACGYADFGLRARGAGGYGWLAGRRRPFLGRVSMDLTAVDVTGCPEAVPGAEVELLGPHIPLDDAAAQAGSIPHEVLTSLQGRISRRIVGEAHP